MEFKKRYLPNFVYGGIDGAITTVAVVAAALGASLSVAIVLVLGFANLIADGFSMGVSNYLASKSTKELHRKHRDAYRYAEPRRAFKNGIATFISFVVIGIIPLLPFILAIGIPALEPIRFLLSIVFTGIALVIVGAIRGKVVEKSPFHSSLETLIVGGIAAVLAFTVGFLLRGLVAG